MAKFAIQTLEFDKVKEMLAGKTATSLGRERVMNMRIESDFASVKRLQEETAEALRLLDDGKRFPFGGAYNILPQVKRARIGSVLEPEELMQVGTTCEALRMVKQFLADEAEIAPQLAEYAAGLEAFPKLERLIASTVSEKGEILDSASTKLAGLRTGVQVAKNRVREKLDSILHDPNNQKYFQDALVTMRGDRYVIPIKQEYRYNFPGVVHDQSGSGATLFIEPMAVVNLNNDIKRYLAQEQEEIERILRSISGMVGADASRITQAMEQLTELDFIAARAYLAQQQKAARGHRGQRQQDGVPYRKAKDGAGCQPLPDAAHQQEHHCIAHRHPHALGQRLAHRLLDAAVAVDDQRLDHQHGQVDAQRQQLDAEQAVQNGVDRHIDHRRRAAVQQAAGQQLGAQLFLAGVLLQGHQLAQKEAEYEAER